MRKHKPKIDPEKESNQTDWIALHMMRHHFAKKKLTEALEKENTLKYLGKLVILENILSYKLAYLIRFYQNRVNGKLKDKRLLIATDQPLEILASDTFGSLVVRLEKISPTNSMLKKLKEFNSERNLLTHFMHLGFTEIREITNTARSLVLRAEKLSLAIDSINKKETPKIKIRIPKVISASELIKYEKELQNAKYPTHNVEENLKKYNSEQRKNRK